MVTIATDFAIIKHNTNNKYNKQYQTPILLKLTLSQLCLLKGSII